MREPGSMPRIRVMQRFAPRAGRTDTLSIYPAASIRTGVCIKKAHECNPGWRIPGSHPGYCVHTRYDEARRKRCAPAGPSRRRWSRSDQLFQGLAAERQDVALAAVAHLHRPVRVDQQGAAHGHQVELLLVQALQQLLDAGRLGHLVGVDHELQELAVQADAADGDGRLAGELAGPAGQVEVGTLELRL